MRINEVCLTTRWNNLYDAIQYFKHEGYHKSNNNNERARIEITEARGDEDVTRVPSLGREVRHVGEVRDTTKVTRRHEGSPSSPWASSTKKELNPLLVDLEVTSEPLQTFPKHNPQPGSFRATLAA